jgi:hypothetical protein
VAKAMAVLSSGLISLSVAVLLAAVYVVVSDRSYSDRYSLSRSLTPYTLSVIT